MRFKLIFFLLFLCKILCGIDCSDFIKNIHKDFYLKKITFDADISFERDEFFYLTNLKNNMFVSSNDIKLACKYLMYKGRFYKIEIEEKDLADGKNLHFILKANWIFKKLNLSGIWFDEYKYSSLYKQQPGDPFDISIHEKSIERIKEYLYDIGYFKCSVDDELIYHKRDKSIIAKIQIKKRNRFFINLIKLNFLFSKDSTNLVSENEMILLKNKIKKKFLQKYLNSIYSKNELEKLTINIKKFLQQQGFIGSRISLNRIIDQSKNSVSLVFKINLNKRIKFKFIGNKEFSEKEILEELMALDYPSYFFTPELIGQQLLNKYCKKGYWQAIINYKKELDGVFLFNINEGARFRIKEVIIYNEEKKKIEEKIFEKLLKNIFFDKNLLEICKDELKNLYLKNGFWDFSIKEQTIIKNKNKKTCKIILYINCGEQRFYEGCSISNMNFEYILKDQFFLKYINPLGILKPFNFYWLQEQKFFLLSFFQREGYWYASIYPKLQISSQSTENKKVKVFIKWQINLNKQVQFGRLIIHGNTNLKFNKIMNQIYFKFGDVWDSKTLDLITKRFKKMDIFKVVNLKPYKPFSIDDEKEKPVILTLVNDDPFQAKFRFGYFLTSKNFLFKRASTFKLGSSVIIKNPTNNADTLIFNVDFNRFERKLNAEYKIISPFGIKVKDSYLLGKAKLYNNKYVHPVEILQSGSAYEADEIGVVLGLNNEYKKGYFCGFNFGNEWIKTRRARGNIKFSKNLINKTLPFFFIQPNFLLEELDNKMDVKNGQLIFFSFKAMLPEDKGGIFTTKLMFEQALFRPIIKNVIGAARVRFGYIFRNKFKNIQPSQRFYLGGPYSVRGYQREEIPPLGISEEILSDGKVIKKYTIQGGSGMLNGNIELRFPIYKLLRGVIFQDVGVLSQSGISGFKGKWFPSSGFGLRYKTPIGVIRFDIGLKWKKTLPGDASYTWYLTLGEAF